MKLLTRESRVERGKPERSEALAASGSQPSILDPRRRRPGSAFTLLEVTIACAIFFVAAFAILELVTHSLVGVRSLQKHDPDPGIILHALSLTNSFEEGTMSGDYEDIAPGMYPGYRWEAFITEIGSNGLFQVDVLTYNQRKRSQNPTTVTGQFWRPLSKPGSATKGRP